MIDNQFQDNLLGQLGDLNENLKTLTQLIDAALTPTEEGTTTAETESDVIPKDISVSGEDAPWIQKAREYFGMDEKDDHAVLSELMGGIDPEKTPWCAYFVDEILGKCGLPKQNSGLAADFANYGVECEKANGAIAVFDGHVGFVVKDTKILGGNQGDMVKENNLQWYHDNRKFLGYRCPKGYKLT